MISLERYEEYWNSVKERVSQVKRVIPVTMDQEMGKEIQSLGAADLPALFVIIPEAHLSGDVDNLKDNNFGVVFIMDRADPQRKKAYQVQKETQPVIEDIKQIMIDDRAAGCTMLRNLDIGSISTVPESGFYANFAGWSIGFQFKT